MDDHDVIEICAEECGAACCSGHVYLAAADAERIRDAGHSEFVARHDGVRVMQTDEDDACRFLDDHRCSVYDDRPIDCRLYPFGFVLAADRVEIVLARCPLSEYMDEETAAEMLEGVKELIGSYSREELLSYDRLPFSSEYSVVETVPLEELLGETAD